ncbi:hypothetical protein EYC84_002901 [Monilinia fructicola]|uniref:Uncharacterized protein n=1 Tax=Monilinia fructicola TaxID=38448 RepID=A0A5M9K028_MONFR|nr:hypothetical protein EYC84_002901 [Monilinia fructicola]
MQFPTLATLLALAATTTAITVSYDVGYDDASRSLAVVSCSDGTNGLLTQGYTTQGSLKNFPQHRGRLHHRRLERRQLRQLLPADVQRALDQRARHRSRGRGLQPGEDGVGHADRGQAEALGRIDAGVGAG